MYFLRLCLQDFAIDYRVKPDNDSSSNDSSSNDSSSNDSSCNDKSDNDRPSNDKLRLYYARFIVAAVERIVS